MATIQNLQAAQRQTKNAMGVVVSAGTMSKTVKVRITRPIWNKRVQKQFTTHIDHLVHDPSNTARLGDIVSIMSGFRVSTTVRHRLAAVISPVGAPLSERPPIPSASDLLLQRKEHRARRDAK
ncbi:ribosomal protein S17, partial [Rhizodiscina lignyota]